MFCVILVTFVQLKKREKHSWRSVTFRNPPPCVFSRFLNCTSIKSNQVWYQIAQNITYKKNNGPRIKP